VTRTLLRLVLIACGTLAVVLGIVGIFLPVLPTTVFMLLAAACYARSSERFYQKLITNRYLGRYIRNSREGRGMTRRQKASTLALLWIGIGASAIFSVEAAWLRALLILIAMAVTVHVVKIKAARAVPVPARSDVPS
jgi:uncharacterized membrane protein YbaN (DUF454 family)